MRNFTPECTALGECRSDDFAQVNDKYIRFSAVQMPNILPKIHDILTSEILVY